MRSWSKLIVICAFTFSNICFAEQKYCFDVKNIEFKGASCLVQNKKRELHKKYTDRCLSQNDLQELIREITNYYIGNGYISTRTSIPQQDLKSGTLVIEIHEGRVEQIEYREQGADKSRFNILPGINDKILNLRDLEQGVDQMSRLRSNDAKIYLKPGSKENTSVIVIDNESSKKWFVTTGIDNYGSKNKGQNEFLATATLEDILGMSEIYSVGHKRSLGDTEKRITQGYSGAISVPYGYNNFTMSYGYTSYRTFIQAATQKFKNHGNSQNIRANWDRVIHRDGASKTIAGIGVGHENYSNYIADTKIHISSYEIQKVALSLKHQRRLSKSIIGMGIDYTQGVNTNYIEKLGNNIYPARTFNKVDYDLSWIRPFALNKVPHALKFTSSLHGQYSPNILCGSEKISMGGLGSIRGFKDSVENTDNGAFIRNEVSLGITRFWPSISNKITEDIEIFFGYDIGKFSGDDEQGKVHGTMTGGAIGVRNTQGIITFDLTLGKAFSSTYIKRNPIELYLSAQINI